MEILGLKDSELVTHCNMYCPVTHLWLMDFVLGGSKLKPCTRLPSLELSCCFTCEAMPSNTMAASCSQLISASLQGWGN